MRKTGTTASVLLLEGKNNNNKNKNQSVCARGTMEKMPLRPLLTRVYGYINIFFLLVFLLFFYCRMSGRRRIAGHNNHCNRPLCKLQSEISNGETRNEDKRVENKSQTFLLTIHVAMRVTV